MAYLYIYPQHSVRLNATLQHDWHSRMAHRLLLLHLRGGFVAAGMLLTH
jgi:hypothetical protein